jgi:UDP-glucose 4-epimerase
VKHIVFGGAGFIGTNLCRRLLKTGSSILIVDNFSNSNPKNLPNSFGESLNVLNVDALDIHNNFEAIETFLDNDSLTVWQLAANSDIIKGVDDPVVDYRDTLGTTIASLQLVRNFATDTFVFSSSSAIYGDLKGLPVTEDFQKCLPISNYGLMKLASEQLIELHFSFVNSTKVRIYRFPNVIGLPLTHGVIKDLQRKLMTKPTFLDVLGDGNQTKPFMYVEDLIDAMLALNDIESNFEIFNIGPEDQGIAIRQVAEQLRNRFSPGTEIRYGSSQSGWQGDVPIYALNTSKSRGFGVKPMFDSSTAVKKVIEEIENSLK